MGKSTGHNSWLAEINSFLLCFAMLDNESHFALKCHWKLGRHQHPLSWHFTGEKSLKIQSNKNKQRHSSCCAVQIKLCMEAATVEQTLQLKIHLQLQV